MHDKVPEWTKEWRRGWICNLCAAGGHLGHQQEWLTQTEKVKIAGFYECRHQGDLKVSIGEKIKEDSIFFKWLQDKGRCTEKG